MASFPNIRLSCLHWKFLSVATFIYDLSQIFWITCYFTLHFYITETASFPKLHEPFPASLRLFFQSFFTSLSLHKIEESRALLLSGLRLKRILWLVWASIQATQTYEITPDLIKVFHKRTSFLLIPTFCMPASLSLIIFNLSPKVRDVWLFPSLEHLEAPVKLLTGLISILLRPWEPGGLMTGREMGELPGGGAVRKHTFIKFAILSGWCHSASKQLW